MWCVLALWPVFGKENEFEKEGLVFDFEVEKCILELFFGIYKTFSWPFKPNRELLK